MDGYQELWLQDDQIKTQLCVDLIEGGSNDWLWGIVIAKLTELKFSHVWDCNKTSLRCGRDFAAHKELAPVSGQEECRRS